MQHENNQKKIDSIIGIRGIACLCIVCFHFYCLFVDDMGLGYSDIGWMEKSKYFFEYSKNAVELFFMLAGFLIAWHYRDTIANMSFVDYFKKRYGKLIGASIAVNLWALVNALIRFKIGLGEPVSPVTPLRTILSILMVNTGWFTSYAQTQLPLNTTMWFIDVLLLCYLLYYIIRKLGKNDVIYILLCAVMVLVGWICLEHTPKLPFLWGFDGRGYATFFLGTLLAEFQIKMNEKWRVRISTALGAFLIVFFIFHMIVGFERVFGDFGTSTYVRYFEFVVAPGLLLAALNLSPITRFFEWKPFVWLGILSSSIYYVHNNVMEDYMILNKLCNNPLSFLSLPFAILVILSVIPVGMLYQRIAVNVRNLKK